MKLDRNKQCCGHTPIFYDGTGWPNSPGAPGRPYYRCLTCKRDYDMLGMQRENSVWKRNAVGRYCRRTNEERRGYIIRRGNLR